MATSQSNVLHAVTQNVIQGMQRKGNFGGMEIARPVGQNSLTANWPTIVLNDNFGMRNELEGRTPGAGFKQIDANITLDTSTVTGDGMEVSVDKSIIADATKSGLNVLSAFGSMLMQSAYIKHENDVATLAQGSTFDSVNSGTAYTTGNKASADPAEDIQAAIDRVNGRGENADTIVIPVTVWNRIRFFAQLKSFIAGTVNPAAMVTASNLAKAFADEGIQRVIIGKGRENTAKKGQDANIATIWGTSHIWVGSTDFGAETGDNNSLGNAIATFYSDEHPAPYFLENYYCDKRRSEVLRVFGETNVKTINAQAGTRIATQYA